MKTTFLVGLLAGLAAVIGAGRYYPWVDHVRVLSRTSVLANGGRSEQFLVRLPADRVVTVSNAESGSRLRRYPASVSLPDDAGPELLFLEHFKVRDSAGDVIGIASRHTVQSDRRIETAWNLFVPSRGALLLRGEAAASTLDRRLIDAGFRQGTPWVGDVRIPAAQESASGGDIMAGTGEFAGLTGAYTEAWQIAGVGPEGELRGTIELNTVSRFSR